MYFVDEYDSKWVIVSPNFYNDSEASAVVCLKTNGEEIWSVSKNYLETKGTISNFMKVQDLKSCLSAFKKKMNI